MSTLTQARYAAGAGFTHIRFDDRLVEERPQDLEMIQGFLSGIACGCSLQVSMQMQAADYVVDEQAQVLIQGAVHLPIRNTLNDGDQKVILSYDGPAAGLSEILAGQFLAGISFAAPEETKLGWVDTSQLQELIEIVQDW